MKILREHINEKFKEDSDPITDMGIGMRHQISQWMKEIGEKDTDDNALAEAAYYGKLDFVKYLAQNGANIHARDDYALRWASDAGHLEMVKYLVQKGANIHANNDGALLQASSSGHLEVVKYLVQNGADIHARDDGALAWASNYGRLEVVKYLVQNGADIHADDDEALRWASEKGHLEVVKYLESQMKKDKIVKESLLEKFTEDSDPITDMGIGMRHLISKWMKEIGEEDTDDNALVYAAIDGKLDFVKYLVQNGADIHVNHDYALRYASYNGHLEVVKYLVQNGANIHANNDAALRWASENGHLEVVKYLVQNGANIHANDDLALRWASSNGHLEVVKFLVQNGADIHTYNDYVLQNGHLDIVEYLESQMKKDKIVKESLLEKFVEDSDPIKDMGIGIFRKQTFENGKKLAKFLYDNLKHIVEYYGYRYTGNNVNDIMLYADIHKFIKYDIEKSIKQYIKDFVIDYKLGWDGPNKYSGYLSYFIDYVENN